MLIVVRNLKGFFAILSELLESGSRSSECQGHTEVSHYEKSTANKTMTFSRHNTILHIIVIH